MDLSDLYTPKELAEHRVSFLNRLISLYDQEESPFELARTLTHKLQGTGGNLCIQGVLDRVPQLRHLAHQEREPERVRKLLGELRMVLSERCKDYQQEINR